MQMRGVTKSYTAQASQIEVLSDIHANLWRQNITLLLGSNGAGKTTLMKILSGLDADFRGSVHFPGVEQGGADAKQNQRQIGWCPQNDALFDHLTVREHLLLLSSIIHDLPCAEFTDLFPSQAARWRTALTTISDTGTRRPPMHPAPIRHERRREAQIVQMLGSLDLLQHSDKEVFQLSGGMKRRLSLCLAFLGDPPVLLLVEPTSGCDSYTRQLVRRDILALRSASAVLLSTHHTDDVAVGTADGAPGGVALGAAEGAAVGTADGADSVWFLSERHFEVDEAVQDLAAWRDTHLRPHPHRAAAPMIRPAVACEGDLRSVEEVGRESSSGAQAMEFSTLDPRVKALFEKHFGRSATTWVAASIACASTASVREQQGVTTWTVPVVNLPALQRLVANLEEQGLRRWSLHLGPACQNPVSGVLWTQRNRLGELLRPCTYTNCKLPESAARRRAVGCHHVDGAFLAGRSTCQFCELAALDCSV